MIDLDPIGFKPVILGANQVARRTIIHPLSRRGNEDEQRDRSAPMIVRDRLGPRNAALGPPPERGAIRDYNSLVAARKACRICVERNPGKIRSCAEFEYDPNVISHWELWLGHKRPKLLVVGQDFGNVDYFVRNCGRDDPDNKTNHNLWKLIAAAGIRAQHPRESDSEAPVFLTNSVLCLKEGMMNGPVRASWVSECTERHLRPLLAWLGPPVVVAMGGCGWRAVRQAFALRRAPRLISAAAGLRWTTADGTTVFAVGHCSPLGLINRPWRQQVADWRQVGEAVLSVAPK